MPSERSVYSDRSTMSSMFPHVVIYEMRSNLRREVIIGNPSIADVAVQGPDLLVVTGKTFGVTNVIALDQQRNVIQDQRIIVQRDEARVVNLHKGSQRQSFTCSPNCIPTITIGDDSDYFETISKHAKDKMKFSEQSLGASADSLQ